MRLRLIPVLSALLLALPLIAATFPRNAPSTTNNDDSCDIGNYPAATLLLPYFEVSPVLGEQTTHFTVTNTGHLPQAIRITLWTDFGFPVIAFNAYLTGYDAQSFDLHDLIFRGRIAPDVGTGVDRSPVGSLSGTGPTQAFDNPQLTESTCASLVIQLPGAFITRMREAFTAGRLPALGSLPECEPVGLPHLNAIGYVTVDVTTVCANSLPTDPSYFTAEIAYDNVLMGDYVQLDPAGHFAQGGPMVHIRAMPEGGRPSTRKPTNFTRTFYSRLQPAARRTLDGRQPLPSTFGARWIQGTGSDFATSFKIWREAGTPGNAACADYASNVAMPVAEVVRFDEEENPEVRFSVPPFTPIIEGPSLPVTARITLDHGEIIPPNTIGAPAGWIYFNLNSAEESESASQNWVIVSMQAAGRYSVDSDAISLGNGCTPPAAVSNANDPRGARIGPAPNTTP